VIEQNAENMSFSVTFFHTFVKSGNAKRIPAFSLLFGLHRIQVKDL